MSILISCPRSCLLYLWAIAIPFFLLLGSCGGDGNDTPPPASQRTTPSTEIKKAPPPMAAAQSATEQSAPSSPSSAENTEELKDSMQLAQLARIPYLSKMSKEEILAFRNQTRNKSPYQREALIDQHPSLSALPVQQKQMLLDQLAQIVPITTPSALLTCVCENDLMREMCVQELCSEAHALSSICKSVCGTASRPFAACKPSQQCSGK
jgi:hypothetical protein